MIGFALRLSVSTPGAGKPDHWQTVRLFLMPFGVSSFSSLIKGQGFVLIIPPRLSELLASAGLCAAFALLVTTLKFLLNPEEIADGPQ